MFTLIYPGRSAVFEKIRLSTRTLRQNSRLAQSRSGGQELGETSEGYRPPVTAWDSSDAAHRCRDEPLCSSPFVVRLSGTARRVSKPTALSDMFMPSDPPTRGPLSARLPKTSVSCVLAASRRAKRVPSLFWTGLPRATTRPNASLAVEKKPGLLLSSIAKRPATTRRNSDA